MPVTHNLSNHVNSLVRHAFPFYHSILFPILSLKIHHHRDKKRNRNEGTRQRATFFIPHRYRSIPSVPSPPPHIYQTDSAPSW
ncbi:hypothetical protein P167DRAFT_537929 [Morchella conica CCBAS932]|uniref:Uncharacterized protein n=1 Tax=Morchella conica CCBAS932 TaxID=1392247 RepID=A0A3N4KKP7_9PEZI|nr:hypothetical protein P167DRAFT_537929 [Morchella conica CCBAS932]